MTITMTKRYENQLFTDFTDRDGQVFENLELVNCSVDLNLSAKNINGDRYRTTIRHCRFTNLKISGFPRSSIFEDIEVDGLKVVPPPGDYMMFEGSLFRHVAISGKLSGLALRFLDHETGSMDEAERLRLERYETEFYKDTDWALDIANAQISKSPELDSIPGHLIIRDPETQVLITKDRASKFDHTKIDLGPSGWQFGIFNFRNYSKHDSFVLAAATAGPRRSHDLKAIETLRKLSVATPEDEATIPQR